MKFFTFSENTGFGRTFWYAVTLASFLTGFLYLCLYPKHAGDWKGEWLLIIFAAVSLYKWKKDEWLTLLGVNLLMAFLGAVTISNELFRLAMENNNGVLVFGPGLDPYAGILVYGFIPPEIVTPIYIGSLYAALFAFMIKHTSALVQVFNEHSAKQASSS